ncbi:MAG: SGNH/GDSL hydrolase family protein, partial [Gemmatimonadaceae bacterium]
MFRIRNVARSAVALGLVALVSACDDDTQRVFGPPTSNSDGLFSSYVALGNSITAGYQSGGILDSTQRRSYAVLVAQRMNTGFIYPALAGRGCAPPIVNFLTQARFTIAALGPSTGATCDLRTPSFTDLLNNVAVPGALAADLTVAARTASVTPNVPSPHVHATLFLGGKSQVQKALENDPTFASIWIGNNDILLAAVAGVLFPLPTVSIGVTPPATYQTQIDVGIAELQAGAPGLEGILIGVANVVNVPALFPTDSLRNNATFRGQFDAAAGRVAASTDPFKAATLVIDANCSTTTNTLVSI